MKKIAWWVLGILLVFVAIPVGHVLSVSWSESSYEAIPTIDGVVLDAARISSAENMHMVSLSTNRDESIALVQNALSTAKEKARSVTIGGARHSMGGQTLLDGSIHIDMDGFSAMYMEEETILRV